MAEMKITQIKISTALRFDLNSDDSGLLPVDLQVHGREVDIGSVTFGVDAEDLWVVHCKHFSVFKLSDLQRFELWYWTPAKGPGSISIGAGYRDDRQGSAMLCRFDTYSDGQLASAKTLVRDLHGILGYQPKTTCYGADC